MSLLEKITLAAGLLWFVLENILNYVRRSGDKSKRYDQSSFLLIYITMTVCMFFGIGMMIYGKINGLGKITAFDPLLGCFGLLVVFTGLAVRGIAILTLKKLFTVTVSIEKNHKIIDHGIYRYVRHPAYLGSLLICLGFGLAFENWISLLIVFLPVLFVFLNRIKIEEKVLADNFGDEYKKYALKTKRLIPGVF